MNNQKKSSNQITIPNFVWVIAVVLVLCIIFLIFVQRPFMQKIDKYHADHASAVSQISMYEDYLARATEVEKKIAEMKEKYNEESAKLFVNATQSPKDIKDMVNKLDYDPNSVSISQGAVDGQGRKSSTGDPLYVTSVSINFETSEENLLSTLDYFELESDGSYYVENLNVTPVGLYDNTGKKLNIAADKLQYSVSLNLSLYYFPPKVEQTSISPVVSGTQAATSTTSSTTSSASSAA